MAYPFFSTLYYFPLRNMIPTLTHLNNFDKILI